MGEDRPRDEDPPRERAAAILREFARSCDRLGSPFYGRLLALAAVDETAGGPVSDVLSGAEHEPSRAAVPLRMLGGVHALVLAGRAPELAPYYPSVGGSGDGEAAWPVFRDVLVEHRDEVRRWLRQAPQTNEVGRAAGLIGGLYLLASHGLPLRLFEIGASAGLNLRADHFRVELGNGHGLGPVGSPVVLRDAWVGPLPPLTRQPVVVDRRGCDLDPVDPTTAEGRLRLQAYVWPDQAERLSRLRGALDLAATVPAPVVRQGAAEFVADLRLAEGTTTVLWHSVMWQYLDRAERVAVGDQLAVLGSDASYDARLAHVYFEPRQRMTAEPEFVVVLQEWPGGGERVLGVAPPHGLPVTWTDT